MRFTMWVSMIRYRTHRGGKRCAVPRRLSSPRRWPCLVLCLFLPIIAVGGAQRDTPGTSSILLFEEAEAGVAPYPVRVLVNRDYLRMDDASDSGDFVLLDRGTRTVYSVSHAERSILVIGPQPGERSVPDTPAVGHDLLSEPDAPPIAGREVLHYVLHADGEVCYEAYVVPGLLDEARRALTEYVVVLAGQHLRDLDKTPEEMRSPCFLARYIHAAAGHLEAGLPVQEWDGTGYRRSLFDFETNVPVSGALFVLPEGYRRYHIQP
jgi:hypothetical protein